MPHRESQGSMAALIGDLGHHNSVDTNPILRNPIGHQIQCHFHMSSSIYYRRCIFYRSIADQKVIRIEEVQRELQINAA